jgi:polysaccharide export outer membrane protein
LSRFPRLRSGVWALAVVACVAVAQGTLHAQETPPPVQEQAPQDPAPPKPDDPPPAAAPVDPRTYMIGIQDVIAVRVWRERELSGDFVVRPDGKISMPLAGEIEADGITPDQLKTRIVEALTNFMNRPEVTLEVRQVNSKRFFITGEINRPGAFVVISPISVLEAISNAGGLKDFANGKKIVIMRGNERLKFNYKEVIKGKNMEQNILLQPGDHIIIP